MFCFFFSISGDMCNRYYTRIAFHGCINSSLFFKNQFENLPVFLSWGGGPPTHNSVVFNLCFELTSYFPKETWGGTQAYGKGSLLYPQRGTSLFVLLKENFGKLIHICTLKYLAPPSPKLWGLEHSSFMS